MKLKYNNNYVKWGLTIFSVLAAGVLFVYLIFNWQEFSANINKIFSAFTSIGMGFVIAYLLTPILNFLENKILYPLCIRLKIKDSKTKKRVIRGISIVVSFVIVFWIIYILFAMLISQIVPSIQTIINNFDTYVNNINDWINELPMEKEGFSLVAYNAYNRLVAELDKWLEDTATLLNHSGEIIKTVSMSLISFVKVAWDMLIGLMISIYMLASKETFLAQAKKIVFALFERNTANKIIESMRFTHKTFIGFISGKILDSLIIGILCFIGTSILGTPYAALVSVVVGVTNVIPVFGPYLGAIPSAILILVVDLAHPLNCVYFLIFILVLQQFDGNVLGPLILGDSTGLSGFWVIFSITIFGGFFGIMGMIVGVPVFAVLYAAVRGFINGKLSKKDMPLTTELYQNVDTIDEQGIFHEAEPEKQESSEAKNKKDIAITKPLRKVMKNIEKQKDKSSKNS